MRHWKGITLSLMLIGALWHTPVAAQFPLFPGAGMPVYDAANHLQNTITAVQAVLIVANQIIELTALEGLVLDGSFSSDLAALNALVSEAQGFDVGSVNATILPLFALETAPMTTFEYHNRQVAINQALFESYGFAMRTQTLIMTALRTVEHILGILEQVGGAIGNLTISQSMGQAQTKLQQLLVESNVQRSAFERAKSLEGAMPGVLMQGLMNINNAMLADHPR
jgi:conjugal transfer/entry exclusion protein